MSSESSTVVTPSASATEDSNRSISGSNSGSIMTSTTAERTDANGSSSLKRKNVVVKLPRAVETESESISSGPLPSASNIMQGSSNPGFPSVVSPSNVERRQDMASGLTRHNPWDIGTPASQFTSFDFSFSDPSPRLTNHQKSKSGNSKLFGPPSTTPTTQGSSKLFTFADPPPKTANHGEKRG